MNKLLGFSIVAVIVAVTINFITFLAGTYPLAVSVAATLIVAVIIYNVYVNYKRRRQP